MFKSIKTRIPKEEQRTVRIAVIGIDSKFEFQIRYLKYLVGVSTETLNLNP